MAEGADSSRSTRTSDWTGDYVAAGVTAIRLDVNNTGANDLFLRIGVRGSGGTGNYTTNSMTVSTGTGWQTLTFSLALPDLIGVGGAGSSDAAKTNALSEHQSHSDLFGRHHSDKSRGRQHSARRSSDGCRIVRQHHRYWRHSDSRAEPRFALLALLSLPLLVRKRRELRYQVA